MRVSPSTLPEPNLEEKSRSKQLSAVISEAIQAAPTHIISFSHYMELALYTPGLGYYMAEHPIFGWEGDFTTAPELSPLFGQCMAHAIGETLEKTRGDILEIGAGSGKLALDILQSLSKLPAHYYIYELSPALRKRQQQYLQEHIPDYYGNIVWLEQLPAHFDGVIIANEVMDALPADCFTLTATDIVAKGVSVKDGQFVWADYPASEEMKVEIKKIQKELPDAFYPPYTSEIQMLLPVWIKSLAHLLQNGIILLIDYGFMRTEYYHPERSQGTLMCHYKHLAHDDPFLYPGLQDITVHVDFTRVAEAAEENGLKVIHFSNQAQFLLECGLINLLEKDPDLGFATKHQVQVLTSPVEMGEMFKVMMLEKNSGATL